MDDDLKTCPWCGGMMDERHLVCEDAVRADHKERIALEAERDALRERVKALEGAFKTLTDLAEELCEAEDCIAEDIGGTRAPLTILRDIGPHISTCHAALKDADT